MPGLLLRRGTRRLAIPAAATALALLVGACGDNDDEDATTAAASTSVGAADGDLEMFCDAYVEIAAVTAGPMDRDLEPALAQLVELAPDEIADAAETLADQLEERIEVTGPPAPEYLDSTAAVGLYAVDHCADARLQVTAVDHRFVGLPSTFISGRHGFVLSNEGSDWHEIIIFEKRQGVTEPYAEILTMPDSGDMATGVGGAFAGPGERSGIVLDLEPGEYAAVCFIPVGTASVDGPLPDPVVPHFSVGMVHDFTVEPS